MVSPACRSCLRNTTLSGMYIGVYTASDCTAFADAAERHAAALLVSEGALSPFPDNTLRPAAAITLSRTAAVNPARSTSMVTVTAVSEVLAC